MEPNSWNFEDESGFHYFTYIPKSRISDIHYDDETLINKFLYYSRQVTYMPQRWKQNTNGGFGLAQVVEPTPTVEVPTKISEHFWIEDKTKGKLNAQALETVSNTLEHAYTYFASQLAMPQPKGWHPPRALEKKIPAPNGLDWWHG